MCSLSGAGEGGWGGGASCEGASRWAARERRVRAPEQREIFIVRLRSVVSWLRRAGDKLSPLFLPSGFWKRVESLSGGEE